MRNLRFNLTNKIYKGKLKFFQRRCFGKTSCKFDVLTFFFQILIEIAYRLEKGRK